MSSPGRFYFFDLKTKLELTSHPLNGSVFEGTGSFVDWPQDKRLPARYEIFVGRDGRRVTIDDFFGCPVGVKLWFPADAEARVEKFFLVSEPPEDWEGPSCSICDGLGHGYPGGGPCPLEDRGSYDPRDLL